VTRDIASQSQYSEQIQQGAFNEARRTVTCVICDAVYAPSPAYEYLSLTSAIALESALMSMSHFCFRCRRPACPQCWDEIHGVCGACVQDAHLPFRRASAPLKGALFVAAPQTQGQSEHKRSPLVCVRHGRFQRPAIAARKSAIAPVRMRRPAASSGAQVGRKVPRATTGRPTRELPPLSQDDIAEKDTQPIRHEDLAEKDTQPVLREDPTQVDTQSVRPEDIIELDTRPTVQRSIWRRIEQTLTVCVSLLLLLLLAAILLALVFPAVNILIASTLHIDIRAEIEYLLQLITHLH
jgi:hypothetical protein